mgnify:CR=1 FL=1
MKKLTLLVLILFTSFNASSQKVIKEAYSSNVLSDSLGQYFDKKTYSGDPIPSFEKNKHLLPRTNYVMSCTNTLLLLSITASIAFFECVKHLM